jgi:hypothetical protein
LIKPKAKPEAALSKNVIDRLWFALAKQESTTIWPTGRSSKGGFGLQAKRNFWRSSHLPNQPIHICGSGPNEMSLADGSRRIFPIVRELPRDGIFHAGNQMDFSQTNPKVDELASMLQRAALIHSNLGNPRVLMQSL